MLVRLELDPEGAAGVSLSVALMIFNLDLVTANPDTCQCLRRRLEPQARLVGGLLRPWLMGRLRCHSHRPWSHCGSRLAAFCRLNVFGKAAGRKGRCRNKGTQGAQPGEERKRAEITRGLACVFPAESD